MHAVIIMGEPPPPSTFSVEDVMEIMGHEIGEEGKLVAHGKVIYV